MITTLSFVEVCYKECAERLIKFPSRVPMFYIENGEIKQITKGEQFTYAVASGLKVYQQYIS